MTTSPSPDAAAEAAQRLLNDRVDAVRALAKSRQARNDVRAQLDEAERADAAAYAAAQRAGWTAEELRKVGFDEASRKPVGRPRRAPRAASTGTSDAG
jgi:hypothetical protein